MSKKAKQPVSPYFLHKQLAEKGCLDEAVVTFVKHRDWVTFVEIQREFASYMPTRGDAAMEVTGTNIIYYGCLSNELCDLLLSLTKSEKPRLYLWPASQLTYLIDGGALHLPIAKRVPRSGRYKKIHWLPVCFRVEPLKDKKHGSK